MIGKIKKGSGFKGCVNYVLGKEQAALLHAEGVLTESSRDIIRSFILQAGMNPDLKKPVGHIALSYSPEPKRRQNREEKIPKPAFHGQSVQTVFGPCHSDRQTSQVFHLHHCVLANLKVYHYRPFPSSRLSTTDRLYPGFPARLLRCDLFHSMAGRKNICPIAAGVSLRPGYGS